MSTPIMINNTVSRTCVLLRSLDGGQHITDLTTVKVIIRKRSTIPFGCCEPGPVDETSCGVPSAASATTLEYPAHDFSDDHTRICFHWDDKLWSRAPGRYMATVYLCGVCIGCFQVQVGKRFTVQDPVNVLFNPCEADVDVCGTDVTICNTPPPPPPPPPPPSTPCCIEAINIVVSPNPVPPGATFTVDADISNCGLLDQLSGYAVITGEPAGVSWSGGNTVTWSGIPTIGFVHKQWTGLNNAVSTTTQSATITVNGGCGSGPVISTALTSITATG